MNISLVAWWYGMIWLIYAMRMDQNRPFLGWTSNIRRWLGWPSLLTRLWVKNIQKLQYQNLGMNIPSGSRSHFNVMGYYGYKDVHGFDHQRTGPWPRRICWMPLRPPSCAECLAECFARLFLGAKLRIQVMKSFEQLWIELHPAGNAASRKWRSKNIIENASFGHPTVAGKKEHIQMIVDLKVHVEIVHYKGRQGSNMRPCESFFLSSRKWSFLGTKIATYFNIRPHEKKRGVPKVNCLFAKNGRLQIKEFRLTATCRLFVDYNDYSTYLHPQNSTNTVDADLTSTCWPCFLQMNAIETLVGFLALCALWSKKSERGFLGNKSKYQGKIRPSWHKCVFLNFLMQVSINSQNKSQSSQNMLWAEKHAKWKSRHTKFQAHTIFIDICCQRYSCCVLVAWWNAGGPSGPVEFNPPVLSRWRQAPMAGTPQSFPLAPAAHVQRWCRAAEYAELQAALNWGEWFWSLARQILRWHMPTPDVERGWLRLLHRKGTCYWNGAVADSIWISPYWKQLGAAWGC